MPFVRVSIKGKRLMHQESKAKGCMIWGEMCSVHGFGFGVLRLWFCVEGLEGSGQSPCHLRPNHDKAIL